MVAAHWIPSSSKAISVISTAASPRKLSHERAKKMQIDHGDSVSSLGSYKIERKLETGDSAVDLSSRNVTASGS
ncbi:hypothetical protein KIN20_014049 [Parelaphostrongylus tenuis]|uniref:Uncharacterized protein n=1 Tax=Parelaphostrongylus tenuis TaxID=148309 RepID=A0AAD5MGI1_PARTN|nr:hypothetical protein KIN20_014049 [Parelaphostrongylus tenuis]